MSDFNSEAGKRKTYRLSKDPLVRFVNAIDVLENGCWQWRNSLVSEG